MVAKSTKPAHTNMIACHFQAQRRAQQPGTPRRTSVVTASSIEAVVATSKPTSSAVASRMNGPACSCTTPPVQCGSVRVGECTSH